MNGLRQWLAGRGMAVPTDAELGETGIAFALTVLALAAGWYAGRRLGPRIADLWAQRVGGNREGLARRMCGIVRHGSAALLLAIIAIAWRWPDLATFGLAFAEGAAVAMLAIAVLRGLALPRWTAWTVALLAFAAILRPAIGKATAIQAVLDWPIPAGMRHITLLGVLTAAMTVILLFAAVRLINRVASHLIARSPGFDPTQKLLSQKLAGIIVIVVAFFVGIDLLGIDLTAFAVFSGAFGLAVGFGLQKTIGNLIAGIILLMDRSIKPGDVIVVGESFGWVNKIGVRAVSVITREGKEHLIPNEDLMTREVENWSYTDRNVRVRVPVKVAYDCDLRLAQELMLRAAKESPRVLDTPRTNIRLTAFGDNGVEHEILVWISDPEDGVGNVRSDVLNRLWVLFKEHGIEIPFPRHDVRVREWPGAPVGEKVRDN
jgi:small-conductance mechanosensitive channel